MKRLFVTLLACATILLIVAGLAQVKPLLAVALPSLQTVEMPKSEDLIEQWQTKFLPQIESILTPDQCNQFKSAIAKGVNPRKAFKSIALTPDQKTKLSEFFKTLPKKDIFTSLSPEQKQQLFMKKKELFVPSSGGTGLWGNPLYCPA